MEPGVFVDCARLWNYTIGGYQVIKKWPSWSPRTIPTN